MIEYSCYDYYCSPEGSATSPIPGANPMTLQCPGQSGNTGAPKPPPGYGDDLSGDMSESFSNQQTTSTTSVVGKWPLKPGVLVHSKQQLLKLQSTTFSQPTNDNNGGPVEKFGSNENVKFKSKKNNGTCKVKSSTGNIILANETQSERAARIRRMMIGSNNNLTKKPSPASPPPAPPIRENSGKSACDVEGKHSSVTGRHTTKWGHYTYLFFIIIII